MDSKCLGEGESMVIADIDALLNLKHCLHLGQCQDNTEFLDHDRVTQGLLSSLGAKGAFRKVAEGMQCDEEQSKFEDYPSEVRPSWKRDGRGQG